MFTKKKSLIIMVMKAIFIKAKPWKQPSVLQLVKIEAEALRRIHGMLFTIQE